MTDNAEPETTQADDESSSVAAKLLALQRLDTESDQLKVRRERLAERDDLATRTSQMNEWERRRKHMSDRIAELGKLIESAEESGAASLAERERLEAQMKTVIAPREAEALMHEIDTVNQQRDELDDQELAALEEQAALDDDLTAHLEHEASLRAALQRSDEALAAACADIDRELGGLGGKRELAVAELGDSVLRRYSSVRESSGVAVSELQGRQCTGCHLELSAAEIDDARDEAAATGYCDCPQCGRMLIA